MRISLIVNWLPLQCITQQLPVTTRQVGFWISWMSLRYCAQRLKFCIFEKTWNEFYGFPFPAMHLEKILPDVPAPKVAHSFKSAHNWPLRIPTRGMLTSLLLFIIFFVEYSFFVHFYLLISSFLFAFVYLSLMFSLCE